MSIKLSVPSDGSSPDLKPRLTVIGVGGAGGNAINNMIAKELEGVDFLAANTDAQSLAQSKADHRIQLGAGITQGLGAGSRPDVGRVAAEESLTEVMEALTGSHMVFIAAGMGGGTGTGAAPVIARAAKEHGVLTVAVVTKPFQFEGSHRMRLAEAGIEDLEQYVDTLIIIPNQNLFRIANENTTFADAFAMADEVLHSGVRGVTDLMVMPGLINLDFADIRSVMSEMGKAMMGTGEAAGERRALDAAEAAIANPLLDDTSMRGARGVLINITGGSDITLFEVDEAANRIREEVDQDAYIIIGSAFDSSLDGTMRVSVVATGIDADAQALPRPSLLTVSERPVATLPTMPAPTPRAETAAPVTAETEAPAPETEAISEPMAEASEEMAPVVEPPVEEVAETAEPAAEAEPVTEAADKAVSEPEVISETAIEPAPESVPEPAPAGTPAVGAADAFIPPKPADTAASDVAREADPFAVAALTNGDKEQPAVEKTGKGKAASLFERVTGTGRAAFGHRETADAVSTDPAPAPTPAPTPATATATATAAAAPESNVVRAELPTMPATEPQSAPAAVVEASVSAAPEVEQTRLGGLDPADRIESSDSEEDLLDIPAFLRRQAN